jgi:hypothetical protein
MEHRHIIPDSSRWVKNRYICECGFVTGDRQELDRHLKEQSDPVEDATGIELNDLAVAG